MREHGNYFSPALAAEPTLLRQNFAVSGGARETKHLQTTVHMYIHCIYLQERGRRHDCRILQMGQ
jgi:hypothetical protein